MNVLTLFQAIYQSQSKHRRLVPQKFFFKKTLLSLFMEGVQLPQGYRTIMRRSSLFTFRSPGVPGTHFINLGRMKAE